tara:strand:- start:314 stop:1174 length:861 start_codon:yes stop_codon:yes gene_type:complete
MAETITYDPANDPVAIAEAEARDNETLEQGEKLITEQQNLLAGKYKNAEELEKAYLELQKKQGEASSEEPQPETTEESEPQYYTEDGSVNYETAKEVYGEQLSDTFQKAEIDPFEMNTYFQENNGTLSDDMYGKLEQAGLSKNLVDSYLEGVRQQTGMQQQAQAPILSDAEVTEVHNIAGGKDGYEQLMTWASDNMSDSDAKSFDEVIETGNKAAVTFAVKALMGQYEDAVGRDSSLVQGKASDNSGDVYRSMAEVVRDMNNPEYDRDPAIRADVQRKLERSNLQV